MEKSGFIAKSKCWLRNLLNKAQQERELGALATEDVGRIARDLGLSESELHLAVEKGERRTVALHRLLDILHLGRAEIERREPEAYRDLIRVCMQCAHNEQCRRGFARPDPLKAWPEHCPNATTLRALMES